MPELWRFGSQERNRNAKVHVAGHADRQCGRVTWAQLEALGLGKAVLNRWVANGYLHPTLPGIYAVGHRAGSIDADLVELDGHDGHRTTLRYTGWQVFRAPETVSIDLAAALLTSR